MDSISVASYDMDQSYSAESIAMDSMSVTSYDMDQSYSSFSINDSASIFCGHHLVEDDNSTVVSEFYHEEAEEDDADELDDNALSDLINKLRNGGSSDQATEESPEEAVLESAPGENEKEMEKDEKTDEESQVSDEDLTDDVIAKHLKALNRTTKKRSKYAVVEDDDSESEFMSDTEEHDDMSYSSNTLDGESSDEEEEEEEDAYEKVDEMMKKLGVESSTDNEKNRKWLEMMSKQGAYDFRGAPQTISSKKKWLVNLAAELMKEDSSDDDSDSSVEKLEAETYEVNMKQLEKAAQEAQMLISNTEQEDKDPELAEKAAREARIKPGTSKRRQYKTRANEWQKRQWKKNNTAPILVPAALDQLHRCPQPYQRPATARSVNSIPHNNYHYPVHAAKRPNSVVFPRNPLVAVPEEEPSQPELHSEMCPVVQASANKTPIEKALEVKPTEKRPVEDMKRSAVVGLSKPSPIETGLETVAALQNEQKQKESTSSAATFSKAPSIAPKSTIPSTAITVPTMVPNVGPNVEIPPGFPPYPGFGPKWPWHPNSPRAPEGYRECYMLHMGEFYNQYMEYLQARAGAMNSKSRNGEEIMKASLSSQATFKPLSNKTKAKLSKYPQLTSNRSPKPLSARKNSVVPVSKPKSKTDDASNSSGSSANAEELIDLIKTKPDVVAVGRVHKKSKGKKGKVILISGNELDKQAKEKEKKNKKKAAEISAQKREELKHKENIDAEQAKKSKNELRKFSSHSENTKNTDRKDEQRKSNSLTFPEQPVVAEAKCSCIIM